MVAEATLKEIYNRMDVVEVTTHFLGEGLKKKGASYEACCPFHNEKTPSFRVSGPKAMYKCFGCGKGGDAITFVRDHQRLTFVEAVEWLCKFYEIDLRYDKEYTREQYQEKVDKEKERTEILRYAEAWYHNALMNLPRSSQAWQYLEGRGFDESKAVLWRLGFAPDNSKNLTDTFINKAWWQSAVDIGLLKTKSGVTYDVYRNRITIPIIDHRGNLCGFSGRTLDPQYAKYINPVESEVYDKKSVLFGLHQAAAAIRHAGFAYQVEGNFDVISLHLANVENTVAPCGTALTDEQAKLLRKYTDSVALMYDGDDAGHKAMEKNIDIFLKYNFRVEVCVLPEGQDPDSFARSLPKTKTPELAEA